MRSVNKRIFIGNLPPDVREIDVNRNFSSYGKIISIDIKRRKEGLNENVSPIFAFVNIEIDERTLNKCFREFNYNWNGYEVKLEVAQESFLERLKREREEENKKKKPEAEIEVVRRDHAFPVNENLYKRTSYSSGSDSTSSESEEETKLVKKRIESAPTSKSEEGLDRFVEGSKRNVFNGKLIETDEICIDRQIATPEENRNELKDKKALEADDKRKKSMDLMKNSYIQQKSIIKSALSNVDSRKNNKIIFDDETVEHFNEKRKCGENDTDESSSKRTKVSLFQDDSDEEQIHFGIKKQFEGKSGQKLLELQSRFTSDKRFTLDSRFSNAQEREVETHEALQDDKKQFEILESVLGRKIVVEKPKEAEDKEHSKHRRSMLRYDPSKSEHSKFELKKETKKRTNREETSVEEAKVQVSKDTFHRVTGDLKQSLQEKKPFSLLNMFGRAEVDEDDVSKRKDETKEINKKEKKFSTDLNPFKYDSSDSEDEHPAIRSTDSAKNVKETSTNNFMKTFFFQDDDERLQEAGEFLQRLSKQARERPFHEKRRELKKIVKDKIKNNQRNHRPFRKKLGRHKMIKVKKAKRT